MDQGDRAHLEAVAADTLAHVRARDVRLAPAVAEVPGSAYTDPARHAAEMARIFRRLPLALSTSCEIPDAGAYKAMDVAGIPVLIVREKDGTARAFLNACTHRAAPIAEGCGKAARFTCPYHGWTFDRSGQLIGIASSADFGAVDRAGLGLTPFPTWERGGFVWTILDPGATLDIDDFLGGYDRLLDGFGLSDWHVHEQRTLRGANWKLAFDAHVDWYHLPVLHGQSFGTGTSNRALYHYWGPHQRLTSPERTIYPMPPEVDLYAMADRSPADWPVEAMMLGLWTIFPNISLTPFYHGGLGMILSQIFPGETADESFTVQTYLMATRPDAEAAAKATELCAFLERVVRDEDLAMSFRQQRALQSGLVETLRFGRNEDGCAHFHRWIDRILATDDADLPALFTTAPDGPVAASWA